MANSVSSTSDKSQTNSKVACVIATVTGWEAETYARKLIRYPINKYIRNNFKSLETDAFKPYVKKALEQNGLKDKLKIKDLNSSTLKSVAKDLKFSLKKPNILQRIYYHIYRIPLPLKYLQEVAKGKNAFFYPKLNCVVCNFNKMSVPVFHEIQHKLNSVSPNILIKALAKIRSPLAIIGGLYISVCTMFTNKKKKGEKETINDKVKNNCVPLMFLTWLPLVIEECIANIKGTKIAQKAEVQGKLLEMVKKCHKLSMISYITLLITTPLALYIAKNIRDMIYEKIEKHHK